jgi:hypothetical protein
MTDNRLSSRLRAVEGVYEPRTEFADELHSVLAAKLGFDVPAARALAPPRPASST